jgi:hypothetical protein
MTLQTMTLLLALALSLCSGLPAYADVLELKTGQRVEGTFKQGTAANISVEVAGQTITIELEKVRAIYFGAAPAPTPKPAATQAAPQAPDRFVLWETTIGLTRRPSLKNVGVLDSSEECQKRAASFRDGMKEVAQKHNVSLFYECLPVGVQPTTP